MHHKFLGALAAGLLWMTATHAADAPVPKVTGPIPATAKPGDPSRDYPQLASHIDLGVFDYVEEEFFFEGQARNYETPPLATGKVVSDKHPYKARMIVRRPKSPAHFNGTVLVEWLNVSNNYSFDLMWQLSHQHMLRAGYAYVGVSSQRVGIHGEPTGLKLWSPKRYGTLDVTDGGKITNDGLSFDIYAQAGQAIRRHGAVLGGLKPRHLIAMGGSQSEGYLVRYFNAVQPLAQLYDGFHLFLGSGGKIRTDLKTKVLKLNTENDLIALREAAARQPDSDTLRTWEVAGGGHASYLGFPLRLTLLKRDGLPIVDTSKCEKPLLSRVPTPLLLNSTYDHLARWLKDGTPPPAAPRIDMISIDPPVVARDKHGNALGGLRLAEHAVPTALNDGINGGPGYCFVYGHHQPFDQATLDALYPDHEQYVEKVKEAALESVRQGYLLPADIFHTIAGAERADVGKQRAGSPGAR